MTHYKEQHKVKLHKLRVRIVHADKHAPNE
jgi:hypothetical protein